MSFNSSLLYLYYSSPVIGMLLCLVGIKECGFGTQSLGLRWPLSTVGTRVVALLLQSSPPHNSVMPSWSWDQEHYTTLHNIFAVKYIQDMPISVFNRNQAQQDLQRYPICITDSDNDYIIDENLRWDKISYEIYISIEDNLIMVCVYTLKQSISKIYFGIGILWKWS